MLKNVRDIANKLNKAKWLIIQKTVFMLAIICTLSTMMVFLPPFPIDKAQAVPDQEVPTINNFTLNSDDTYASASTRIVTASGVFNDTGGSSGILQVQFSQDGSNWGVYSGSGTTNDKSNDWTYYTNVTASASSQDINSAWYLEGSDGSKTLYVRAKDGAGNINDYTTFSDTFTTPIPFWLNDEAATTANWDTSAGLVKLTKSAGPPTLDVVDQWGSNGSGDGQFNSPRDFAFDSGGNIYVVDTTNHRVQKFDSEFNFITKWGSNGSGIGQFTSPCSIALDSNNNVYVADTYGQRIQKFDSDGNHLLTWGGWVTPDVNPRIDIDSLDRIYVVSQNTVRQFDSSGGLIDSWGHGASNPMGIAVDSAFNIYVSSSAGGGAHEIRKFDSSGIFVTSWGTEGTADGQFKYPGGISIDSNGDVYVADLNNSRIQKFSSTGTFITKTTYGFTVPRGVAVDSNDDIYVANSFVHNIVKLMFNPEPYELSNIAQSTEIDTTSNEITKATLSTTENKPGGTSITYQLSANGGINWESVTPGVEKTFTNTGSDLRWRATLNGTSSFTPEIVDISIIYYSNEGNEIFDSIILDSAAPSSPINLPIRVVTINSVDLAWTASTDSGGSGLAGYKIERAPDLAGSPGIFTQIGTSATW